VVDADGTVIYDRFEEFGQTQPSERTVLRLRCYDVEGVLRKATKAIRRPRALSLTAVGWRARRYPFADQLR